MPTVLHVVKNVYRKVVPQSVRGSSAMERLKAYLLPHDIFYDSDYYANVVEGSAIRSAGPISESIHTDIKPVRVVDVGCGTGALLEALREKGCEVFGLEYSDAALRRCRARRLNVVKFDLEGNNLYGQRTFDVAVSMEVAEHLPEKTADRYVDILTSLSPLVVFTAAPPGQGGVNHVNLQPYSYWICKFRQHGFEQDVELSRRWQDAWRSKGIVEGWYYQNLMVFRRPEDSPSRTSASRDSSCRS